MLKTAAIALIALVAVVAAQGPPLRGGAGWVFPPGGGGSAISDTTCAGACTKAISDSITAFGRSGAQGADFKSVTADSVKFSGSAFITYGSGGVVIHENNAIIANFRDTDGLIVIEPLRVQGRVGFYGSAPAPQCTLPYATPPNPVTAAQERAAYDLALQNCLDESGVNLVNTP